uniref:Uncharacterized protein n=1 Tax=Oryza punctata TaxID=4537 RepID=A0A0E0MFN9_ORYPU
MQVVDTAAGAEVKSQQLLQLASTLPRPPEVMVEAIKQRKNVKNRMLANELALLNVYVCASNLKDANFLPMR